MVCTHGNPYHARTQRLVALILFWGVPGWAQDQAAFSVETERVLTGARYVLTLRLPDMAATNLTFPSLAHPAGLQKIAGPVVRAATWTDPSGKLLSGTTAQWDFRAVTSGIWEFPPYTFRYRGRTTTVAPVILSIVDPSEAGLRFPLELEWILPRDAPVAGQSFTVSLRVRNLENLPQPPFFILPVGTGNLVEQVATGGEVTEKRIGSAVALDVVWLRWLVTAARSGVFSVPAFKLSIGPVVRRVPGFNLKILPLPPEVQETRAVGEFQYEVTLDALDSQGGWVLAMELRGRGNFPLVRFLAPDLSGFLLTGEEDIDETSPSENGYEGRRRKIYRILLPDTPEVEVALPGFSFWHTGLQRVVAVPGRVEEIDRILLQNQTPSDRPDRLMEWDEVLHFRSRGLFFDPFQYLSLLPGVLALLAAFFWPRSVGRTAVLLVLPSLLSFILQGEPEPLRYQQARENYTKGNFTEAVQMTEEVVAAFPELPLLRLSMALCYAQVQRPAEAIRELRRLALEGIQHPWADALEADLERLEGLESQYKPLTPIPADNLFLIFALTANLGLILLSLGVRRRLAWTLILSFFVLATSLSTGVLGYFLHQARTELSGVIGPEHAALRKIPEPDAKGWMGLSRGTTVQFLGKTDGFTRVMTGYGLEGWVRDGDVLPIYLSR